MDNSIAIQAKIERTGLYEIQAILSHPEMETEVLQWEEVISLMKQVLERYSEITGFVFDVKENTIYISEDAKPPHVIASYEILRTIYRNFIVAMPFPDDGIKTELLEGDSGESIICTTYPNGVVSWETLEDSPTEWKIELDCCCDDNSVSIRIGDNKNPDFILISGFKGNIKEIFEKKIWEYGINWQTVHVNNKTLYNELLQIEPIEDILKSGGRLVFPWETE